MEYLYNIYIFLLIKLNNNEYNIKGEWDTQTTKERLPYQERIVSRIFSAPNYNERNLANDVVSKLKKKKNISTH